MSGWVSRSSEAAWIPSSVIPGGMRMSVTTASGSCSATAASSSGRSRQTATTAISPSCSTIRTIPSRAMSTSSATTSRRTSGAWPIRRWYLRCRPRCRTAHRPGCPHPPPSRAGTLPPAPIGSYCRQDDRGDRTHRLGLAGDPLAGGGLAAPPLGGDGPGDADRRRRHHRDRGRPDRSPPHLRRLPRLPRSSRCRRRGDQPVDQHPGDRGGDPHPPRRRAGHLGCPVLRDQRRRGATEACRDRGDGSGVGGPRVSRRPVRRHGPSRRPVGSPAHRAKRGGGQRRDGGGVRPRSWRRRAARLLACRAGCRRGRPHRSAAR